MLGDGKRSWVEFSLGFCIVYSEQPIIITCMEKYSQGIEGSWRDGEPKEQKMFFGFIIIFF